MAKEAMREFKGLRGALDAPLEELQKIKGIGPSNAFGIKLFQAIAERYAKEKISKRNFLIRRKLSPNTCKSGSAEKTKNIS